jgi:methyltransferase
VVSWFTGLVLLVGVERLCELVVSRRNALRSLAQGAREYGRGHYPLLVLVHGALLLGAVVEVAALDRPFVPAVGWSMLVLVVGSQALRWWCIRTLGWRWSTRVLVVPGLARVTGGPYARVPHPNYVAVVVEGLALPLVHSAWITAVLFTAVNAVLLRVRIRVENAALAAAKSVRPADELA